MNYYFTLKNLIKSIAHPIKRLKIALLQVGVYSLGLLLLFSTCKPKQDRQSPVAAQDSLFRMYSEHVRDSFYISVQLPLEYGEHPHKKYPTLVLTDGNFFYPMLAPILHQYEKGGLLPPLILVSIGYRSFEAMDSLRVRDYMYPEAIASDEMEAVGGGKHFFEFITQELLPKVDSSYRTTGQRTLLGHSFGGYFSLYALLEQLNQQRNDFDSFIAASPTLWYHDRYLFQLPDKLRDRKSKDTISLSLSVGGLEEPTWTIKPVQDFSKQLLDKNIEHFQLNNQFYQPLDHMDVGIISFVQSLETIYTKTEN